MSTRDRQRGSDLGRRRPGAPLPRRDAHPVLALQRAVGNRDTTRLLRKRSGDKAGGFEVSLVFGGHEPIEVKSSNVSDWSDHKSVAGDLVIATTKGKHSDELRRLSASRERIDTLEVATVTSQNTLLSVTFKSARVRGYAVDEGGKTESWKAVDFDGVAIKRLAIGAARP